jgi:hypothetical protein
MCTVGIDPHKESALWAPLDPRKAILIGQRRVRRIYTAES